MISQLKLISVLVALLRFTGVQAQQSNYTIPSARCASPSGYESCQGISNAQFSTCINSAGENTDQASACAYVGSIGTLQCVHENCWNSVYSCEVQSFAGLTAYTGGAAGFPYYPAPDETSPGTCSCNIEAVQLAVAGATNSLATCTNNGGSSLDGINACECCTQAGAYAGISSICPSVDPTYIYQVLAGIDALLSSVYSPSFMQGACADIPQQTDCEKDLNFPPLVPGSSLTYLSTVPSTTDTASWSDVPGEMASPSAEVVTFAPQNGLSMLATAVSGNSGEVASSASGSMGGRGGAAATTTAGASPTTKASDAGRRFAAAMSNAVVGALAFAVVVDAVY